MAYLRKGFDALRRVVDKTSSDDQTPAARLESLAKKPELERSETHTRADLEEAIKVASDAVDTVQKDDAKLAEQLNILRELLKKKFMLTQADEDFEKLLEVTAKTVRVTSAEHPAQFDRLLELIVILNHRYHVTKSDNDLRELISVLRQAVDATQESQLEGKKVRGLLSKRLADYYLVTGWLSLVDEAMQLTRAAIHDPSLGHRHQVEMESKMADLLVWRYMKLGRQADLEEAIIIKWKCVHASPELGPERARYLDSLGASLRDKYSRTRQIYDLKTAIRVTEEAVDITLEDNQDRANMLGNLGNMLGDLYTETKNLADLHRAIELAEKAVDSKFGDENTQAVNLVNLASRLHQFHSVASSIDSLERAISAIRKAIDLLSEDNVNMTQTLNKLAMMLRSKYHVTKSEEDFEDALKVYKNVYLMMDAYSITRVEAGRAIMDLCAPRGRWEEAYRAARIILPHIARLASRSLEAADKQYIMGQIFGLASDAAAVVLRAKRGLLLALNLLEQGRGVLAASIEEMRVDMKTLYVSHPELAEELTRLRGELQQPSTLSGRFVDQSEKSQEQADPERAFKAGQALDDLIKTIREKDGFSDFGSISSDDDWLDVAKYGPIVIINVSTYGCDAMLINKHRMQGFPLDRLHAEDIEEKASRHSLASPDIMMWMWDTIAEPVLDALGILDVEPEDNLTHIWWIATGSLSRFPLHAAGYHSKNSTRTVIDKAISSYSSSVSAIIHGRRRPFDRLTAQSKALLIAMENTPGHSQLRFAAKEVEELREMCKSMLLQPVEPGRSKKDILSHLPGCKIFHFAGHGSAQMRDPSQSSLLLEDWESDQLTVAELLKTDVLQHSPFLAYLSACGTGQVVDRKFRDETLHLASAFQIAGFRHVIGTLWEVDDQLCVDMARMTYEEIKAGGMSDQSVSKGLHKAAKTLRDRWLNSQFEGEGASRELDSTSDGVNPSRDVILYDDEDDENDCDDFALLQWVPYVHYGV